MCDVEDDSCKYVQYKEAFITLNATYQLRKAHY